MTQQEKKLLRRKNGLAMAICFFLPVLIVAANYLRLGIYPLSDRTVLASDGFGQLVNFYSGFNNLLHGEQSFFYTWNGSLGLNFVSLMSYYVNSIFSFLVFFFDNLHMPDAMYFILLTKIGAMGVTFWLFARRVFDLPRWWVVLLSLCYPLMSFTIAYSIMLMWLDAMVYLPLVLLGIHRLMDEKKLGLLFFSYFFLFVTNYYMAFMVGLFSFFYYIVRLLTEWQRYKRSVLPYFITSLLAGGASMVIILPSVMDLKSNGEKLDAVTTFFTDNLGPWDFIVKSMTGVYDTSKFGSSPFIYIGLLPLVFCLFYFFSGKIPSKNKWLYGGLLVLMIASVYLQPLNLFWQGMHSPNMFLFRYSFLYSTLVLLLAGYGLEKVEKEDINQLGNLILGIIAVFITVTILSNKKRYGFITQESLIVTVVLLLAYLLLFMYQDKLKKWSWLLPALFFVAICGELFFNTQQLIMGINREWGYVSRKKYTTAYQQTKPLVEEAQARNTSFYRLENLNPVSRTDSFNYNYSGVTMFSSVRNRHSSQYLDQLGYRSPNTNLTIQYLNNTILMDELLGIKYNIAAKDPRKYGFQKVKTHGEYSLYENKHALPLGTMTDQGIYKAKNNSNQTALLQYLSQQKQSLFQFTSLNEVSRQNMYIQEFGDFTYFSEETNAQEEKSITWEVNIPEKAQAYLTLDTRESTELSDEKVELSVAGAKTTSVLSATGSYYNLGYYEKAQKVNVTAKFTGGSIVRVLRPSVLLLKTDRLDQAIQAAKKKAVDFSVKGNQVKATVNAKEGQVIFTTIPFDEGWQAKIDRQPVKIKAVQDALVALEVPKGKHTVQLTYYPKGMKLGALLLVSCTILFTGYAYWYQKKERRTNEKKE